jgi:hypothetical protein
MNYVYSHYVISSAFLSDRYIIKVLCGATIFTFLEIWRMRKSLDARLNQGPSNNNKRMCIVISMVTLLEYMRI